MRTRYGVSPWLEAVPGARRPHYPRLRGEHLADVVIVGGGLTGCATAYTSTAANLRVILVEADRLGQGGTARSAGLALPEPGPSFREISTLHGVRAARHVFQAWRRASLDLAAHLKRLHIRCGLDAFDLVHVGRRGDEPRLERECRARRDAGLDARWLTGAAARAATALESAAAIRTTGGFWLDPYRTCLGLATAARARGALIAEQTRVTRVRFGRKQVEVSAAGALIRASTVVIATGGATAEFAPLRRHFKRREAYVVLTDPAPAAMRRHLAPDDVVIRDGGMPRRLVRRTADGRILVMGADQAEVPARRLEAVRIQRTGQLMYELLTMYPAISGLQPAFGWEVAYATTRDGLPYIGAHRNYPRHLFALGTGDSVAGAFLAARVLTRAALGSPERGDEVFAWTR